MAKIIRLTESDLTKLIKRVIIESEDEIRPDDLTPEINVSSNELEQHAQEGTSPSSIDVPKLLNNPIGKEIINKADEYCSSQGQSNGNIINFLRDKLREFRQKKREERRQKAQVQEQLTMLAGVGILAGFILITLLLIKIFRGRDGCTRYTKWRNRNFSGYR